MDSLKAFHCFDAGGDFQFPSFWQWLWSPGSNSRGWVLALWGYLLGQMLIGIMFDCYWWGKDGYSFPFATSGIGSVEVCAMWLTYRSERCEWQEWLASTAQKDL